LLQNILKVLIGENSLLAFAQGRVKSLFGQGVPQNKVAFAMAA